MILKKRSPSFTAINPRSSLSSCSFVPPTQRACRRQRGTGATAPSLAWPTLPTYHALLPPAHHALCRLLGRQLLPRAARLTRHLDLRGEGEEEGERKQGAECLLAVNQVAAVSRQRKQGRRSGRHTSRSMTSIPFTSGTKTSTSSNWRLNFALNCNNLEWIIEGR
ncbi:hypothetical protein SEVIR_6G159667v4 [Setaria viridis]